MPNLPKAREGTGSSSGGASVVFTYVSNIKFRRKGIDLTVMRTKKTESPVTAMIVKQS